MTKNYIADLIIAEAKKWVEVREHGFNKGKEVEMFQKAVDGVASGEPWCMAFVQFVAKQVMAQVGSLKSKGKLVQSEHCMTVWNKTEEKNKSQVGGKGMIAIWRHGQGPSGHTGFAQDAGTVYFNTIEGNTNKAGSREGDGVYEKKRLMVGGKMKLMGFVDLPQIILDSMPKEMKAT